jgi:hypothetical protein
MNVAMDRDTRPEVVEHPFGGPAAGFVFVIVHGFAAICTAC